MDRLEAMSTFLAVVEAGSLSAATQRLKTPLATVSRKIFELESHLRTKLFNRSSRNLVLTDAGSSYLESTICPKSSWAGAVSGRPRCFENAEFRQRRSLYRSIEISKRPVDKAIGNFNRAARSSRSDCRKALSLRSNLASSSSTARMKCSRGVLAIPVRLIMFPLPESVTVR